jgi:hypothetical protein
MKDHRIAVSPWIVPVVMAFVLGTGAAAAQSLPGIGIVMTYNVNEGSDFLQVQSASSLGQFLIGVGQIVQQVQFTNPPERMQAVAQQILSIQPQLVSLQEVDQWYTGTFDPLAGACGPLALQYDMLQSLMAALAAGGGHYQVAVKVTQYAFPPTPGLIPPSTYICAAVNDYNVVLARTDLPAWVFSWTNPQSGQFTNVVTLQSPGGPSHCRDRGPRWTLSSLDTRFGSSTPILNPSLRPSEKLKESNCAPVRQIQVCRLSWRWIRIRRLSRSRRTQPIWTLFPRATRISGLRYFLRFQDSRVVRMKRTTIRFPSFRSASI